MKPLMDNDQVIPQSPLSYKPESGWVSEHQAFWEAAAPLWTWHPGDERWQSQCGTSQGPMASGAGWSILLGGCRFSVDGAVPCQAEKREMMSWMGPASPDAGGAHGTGGAAAGGRVSWLQL